MKAELQRLTAAVTALAWAAVLLYFCASGRISSYLAPGFRNYALMGGLGLAVVGVFVILTVKARPGCGHAHAPGEEHDHEHGEMPWWAILLFLIVPAIGASVATRDSFSLSALKHKGAFDGAAGVKLPEGKSALLGREALEAGRPKTESGAVVLDLLEIFFSASDEEYARRMEGMRVALQGRVVSKDGSVMIYRLLLSCCAADGRPLALRVEIPQGMAAAPANSWATLEGVLSYTKMEDGKLHPMIRAESIREMKAPPEEYILRY